ncbi:Transcriptional regulator, contains XRE-family HTH domain [Roseospirillum parvum]|uniref:Transcriptional regulator, contains XRE-family HTH domain n=2 Tax=Roseospirillum parvum TaxID=83401 RepID=A0A1G8EJ42_9PROT|nr:Transcriptional regulator, contains XRE-family HTH domain [Roseospirillum parvum]
MNTVFSDKLVPVNSLESDDSSDPLDRASRTDRHVGRRIRERRIMMGLSQQQMADMIGVTYQQAHKYERGINRISAGRLFEISQVLGVPISFFFEGLAGQQEPEAPGLSPRQRMCLELARNFSQISDERHQEALSQLARALADQEG